MQQKQSNLFLKAKKPASLPTYGLNK